MAIGEDRIETDLKTDSLAVFERSRFVTIEQESQTRWTPCRTWPARALCAARDALWEFSNN